jgi:hypothetical protein
LVASLTLVQELRDDSCGFASAGDAGFTQFGPYAQVLRRLKERSAPRG